MTMFPYKVINFLGAEINYGGRVTDDKDVRLIKTILKNYINVDVMRDGYKFSRKWNISVNEAGWKL
jgi:dynein heavy chain